MKKEIQKWISSIEDITIEEAVNEFFDGDWDPRSWEETECYINTYIEEFQEISDKEEDYLRAKIKEEFDKRVSKLRQEEIDLLKDRKSILNWIESLDDDDCLYEGEVGYVLSKEKILDLILQNGDK